MVALTDLTCFLSPAPSRVGRAFLCPSRLTRWRDHVKLQLFIKSASSDCVSGLAGNLPQEVPREVLMFGDYPRRGRRFWLFLAVVVALDLIGTAMMLHSVNQG